MLRRPTEGEFPAFYQDYIDLVPDGDILSILGDNLKKTMDLFGNISEPYGEYRYEDNKWSMKEVLGHITDTERIMCYRLLRVARGDSTPLAGFNENQYVQGASFGQFSMTSLLEQYFSTRQATISLIKHIPIEAWERKGIANGGEIISCAIAYIISGHELHHIQIIKERYLVNLS